MKIKWHAAAFACLALTVLCFLRSRTSPDTAVQKSAEPASKEVPSPEAAPVVRAPQREQATLNAFWGRLEVDLLFLAAESDAIRREEKLQLIIDSIAFDDIRAALEFFQRQEQTQVLQDLQALLIRKGAATDPEAAASWAGDMPAGSTRSASIGGVAVVWSNQDASAAARWALGLDEGEDREVGVRQVAFEAARSQPAFALELATHLAPNNARDELIRHAARQWAATNPKEAVAWASELDSPALREDLLADISASWGETAPGAAAETVLQSIPSGKAQEDALVGIAQHWVQKEPERAAAWVLKFPDNFQPAAIENIVKIWVSRDAPTATKWAENLPAGFLRDTALSVLAAK